MRAICGDGIVGPDEQCDDGGIIPGDGCSASCQNEECGNGIVDPKEECDDGNDNNHDQCTNTCKLARCGDAIVGPGEECDDGNGDNIDACTNQCKKAVCGDHIVSLDEECDDGNRNDHDACTNECMHATCGDGIVGPGEQCDDGNDNNNDACTNACKQASCGDGIVGPREECDDKTVFCSAQCKLIASPTDVNQCLITTAILPENGHPGFSIKPFGSIESEIRIRLTLAKECDDESCKVTIPKARRAVFSKFNWQDPIDPEELGSYSGNGLVGISGEKVNIHIDVTTLAACNQVLVKMRLGDESQRWPLAGEDNVLRLRANIEFPTLGKIKGITKCGKAVSTAILNSGDSTVEARFSRTGVIESKVLRKSGNVLATLRPNDFANDVPHLEILFTLL
eukprot:TRINITY_DN728_c0_g1_i3.p1 TRINITY_DN728_c0_g1~~TRINITY_DN728_c0_g1_i3.p1  ORF type:complete len:396 (-),score=71.64 TRINITY_DN728_c0_g1_i3:80-1267(-)